MVVVVMVVVVDTLSFDDKQILVVTAVKLYSIQLIRKMQQL